MNIRRSIATAVAAGTLVLGIGIAAPAAHAYVPGPDVIKVNPCVLTPDSCLPDPDPKPDPKGPGDLTIDPCVLDQSCPPPTTEPPSDHPHDDDTKPDTPADPATAVKATATFTG